MRLTQLETFVFMVLDRSMRVLSLALLCVPPPDAKESTAVAINYRKMLDRFPQMAAQKRFQTANGFTVMFGSTLQCTRALESCCLIRMVTLSIPCWKQDMDCVATRPSCMPHCIPCENRKAGRS